MEIRLIRNEAEHARALEALGELMARDPAPETDAAEQLRLLATVIEKYESERFPLELPDPVDAIRFRMEQQGLSRKDLVPIIGSASKVSEVLSGKRPLSLSMIRALHERLGIPAGVLIAAPAEAEPQTAELPSAAALPLKQMHERGYFPGAPREFARFRKNAEPWIAKLFGASAAPATPAYARSTAHYRSSKKLDHPAFAAWRARVLVRARGQTVPEYRKGSVNAEFLAQVACLSKMEKGARVALEFLRSSGIAVVIEPHLPKTYLDGAAMVDADGRPVIGLTLRHERMDNFWFTLLHELVHVGWHLHEPGDTFADALDETAGSDPREQEADRLAGDALIPPALWAEAGLLSDYSVGRVGDFASRISRHPAIVAGRIRRELGDYRVLAGLVRAEELRLQLGAST